MESTRTLEFVASDTAGGGPGPASDRMAAAQWLVCGIAALGFAFDLYELVVLPVVLRPALATLGSLKPGDPGFNLWVNQLFYIPAAVAGVGGLLGGYLTDRFGRRRVLVWSILLYAAAALGAGYSRSLSDFLLFQCMAAAGVAVEYVAAIAWVAESFPNARRRESALGFTQSAVGLGGLMATGVYYLAVTFADRLPPIQGNHDAWRYTLLFGLAPAIPLMLTRPFLPESPLWQEKRSLGALKRPRIGELFRSPLIGTAVVTTLLAACLYAIAFGVLQQTPGIVPGLPQVRSLASREIQQAVGRVQFVGELGTTVGRLLFAFLVIRVVSQRRLLQSVLVAGLIVFSWVYAYAATHSLVLLQLGVFLAALLMNVPMSLLWNSLPRLYPTHLRGTGESFAFNVGGRMLGTLAVVLTTQLTTVVPGADHPARLAHSAAAVAVLAYVVALIVARRLPEPANAPLPD